MAPDETSPMGPVTVEPVVMGFIPADLPVFYSDWLISIHPGPMTVKVVLGRVDPHMQAMPQAQARPVGQLVMPLNGYVQAAAFMGQLVRNMIKEGMLTSEQVAAMSAPWGFPDAGSSE
jgi:hypothetical protein